VLCTNASVIIRHAPYSIECELPIVARLRARRVLKRIALKGSKKMSTNAWWVQIVIALVFGAVAGGWVTLRFARLRFEKQLRRATEELHQRHAAVSEQLRTAQARAQAELEQSRNSFKRQLAVMAAEPRAALERTEDRLKAAYAELDRLRGTAAPDTGSSELTDGFAATRPMRTGM